jgi:transcription antitermination factor NusG
MRERERLFLSALMNADFCIDESSGIEEGDHVRIVGGALTGIESRIKRIDRRRHMAVIEVSTMGDVREMSLMLEILKKVE